MQEYTTMVKTEVLERDLFIENERVLTYSIAYPVLSGSRYQMTLPGINRFYRERAEAYQAYVEKELFPKAEEQYRYAVENGYPVMVYQALTTFRVSDNRCCILSLVFDQYEFTGGAHGNTQRSAQVWNLQGYRRLQLRELMHCGAGDAYDPEILFREIERQIRQNPSLYFDDYEVLLRENFDEQNFYSTPGGLVVFYPQYSIAPYSSGIREFQFPYSACVRDPKTTCFWCQ